MSTITTYILAAGSSRRFGNQDKLLADLGGQSVLLRSVGQALAAQLGPVVVVGAPAMITARLPLAVRVLEVGEGPLGNRLAAADRDARQGACMVHLADMPLVPTKCFARVFQQGTACSQPTRAGSASQPGFPAYFPAGFLGGIANLDQLDGLRASVDPASWQYVALPDPALGIDIDTPEDLARARKFLLGKGS